MRKTINLRHDPVQRGAVLRHARALFETERLTYDPEIEAGLGDIVVGEIEDPVEDESISARADGIEEMRVRDGSLVFTLRRFRPGLIAIPVGNRYAPKCILGGLQNPLDLTPNGVIVGGTTITNLGAGSLAGFVNMRWPRGRPLTHLRVLGTLVDEGGRPIPTRAYRMTRTISGRGAAHGILVGGAGMEVGKTTLCSALFKALRETGTDASYHKVTGTSCFLSDPVRVQEGDRPTPDTWEGEYVIAPEDLRVTDFVDACGVPSDASGDVGSFVADTCGFVEQEPREMLLAELADSLHHRANLELLRSPRFRALFRDLIYVVDPSLDAARNVQYFVRDVLGWKDVRLALAGRIATSPEHEATRKEILARFAIPCLDPRDAPAMLAWVEGERGVYGVYGA